MSVAELIEKLKEYPQDTPVVYFDGSEGGHILDVDDAQLEELSEPTVHAVAYIRSWTIHGEPTL